MPTKAIQTSPRDALRAELHDALVADLVAVAAEDSAQVHAKCIRLSVPNVAKIPKFPLFQGVIGLYTAATALVSGVPVPVVVAGHLDTKVCEF